MEVLDLWCGDSDCWNLGIHRESSECSGVVSKVNDECSMLSVLSCRNKVVDKSQRPFPGIILKQNDNNITKLSYIKVYLYYRPMHNIFNHLLTSLCIGDLLFLFFNLLLVPIALGVDNGFTKWLYPIAESG